MQRIKIFSGFIFAIIAIMALMFLSGNRPISLPMSKTLVSNIDQTSTIDLELVRKNKILQENLSQAVAAYFERAINEGQIVGAGVSIVKGDSILLSDGYGKRKFDDTNNVNRKTVFRLGSLSKGFTGVLAVGLKNEGKINWEDKVNDYLPQFQLGDQNNTAKVNLAHILSHTAGTPYHSFTNLVEAGLSLDKIAGRFDEVKPVSKPGEMYSYQNAMFALSGEIMQKATNKDIGSLLANRIFKPLGMSTASTDYGTLIQNSNVATPHSKNRMGWRSKKLTDHYDNAVAAGGVNASALDMAKWMRFLLGYNSEIMPNSILAEAFEPRVLINIGRKYYKRWPGHISSSYGFGWRIHKLGNESTNKETTVWHHGGSVNNFRNEIAIFPEADLGICVLLNSNSRLASKVIPELREIIQDVYRETSQKSPVTEFETASNSFE